MNNDDLQRKNTLQSGFTLPELIIVIGIFSILSGITVTNLFRSQHNTSIAEAVNTLVTDIRAQQTKTMTGDTTGSGTITNYGIYFQTNSYTLFHGLSYNSSDPANFTVTLDSSLQFSTDLFPGNTLLFSKGSGEMNGFVNGANSISILDTTTNRTKTLIVNKYGVIAQVN